MKIYISGPITGRENLNKEAFDDVAKNYAAQGIAVFNPQDIAAPAETLEGKPLWQYYMRECVRNIPDCTHIYMLKGWFRSEEATEERRIANMLGLTVLYEEG